jgi:hypothetical protein
LFTTIDDPGNGTTFAHTINNNGQVVGTLRDNSTAVNHGFVMTPMPNPPPPAGTTADMVLRGANSSPAVAGQYEIYDIGSNAILAGYSLGQVGTSWTFVTLGGFFGSDTTDMMVRNINNGGLEVYDIRNNAITGYNFMGTVGLNWQQPVFGNFSSRGTSDMILRNTSTGGLEVYDINSNQITGAAFMGTAGLDWQLIASGNFSSIPAESDIIMRNTNTGGLEVYDVANNQITGAFFLGMSGSTGSSPRSPRCTPRARRISSCAISTAARSRSTISPTMRSREPRR